MPTLLELAKDHYWDSLEKDKEIVLKHLEALIDMQRSPVEKLQCSDRVMPHGRLMLTKLEGKKDWSLTSNPRWDNGTRAMNQILRNAANDYAEKKNCGVLHRMIRLANAEKYGLSVDEIKLGWILHGDEAEA